MNANNGPRLAKPPPGDSPVSPVTAKQSNGPYEVVSSDDHGQLHRSLPGPNVHPHEQPTSTAYFIAKATIRWFITALFCGAYYLIVRLYEGRTLSPQQKSVFDWLTIGVTLLLGLNIGSAYKEIALHMKPWFNAKSGVNIKNMELSSLMELIKLMWKTRSSKTRLFCALWVFLNVMVQAGIAAVSLTYSADPDPDAIYLAPGNNITIPNLSRFSGAGKPDVYNVTAIQDFSAHTLGRVGSLYNYTNLPNESLVGAPVAKYPASYWNATDHWEYHFLDSAPTTGPSDFNFLSVYSNRSVKSSAECVAPVYWWSYNQSLHDIFVIYYNDTGKVVYLPGSVYMQEVITYLARSIGQWFQNKPETTDCGPGCSTIYVAELVTGEALPGTYYNNNSGLFFHECNVTVLPTDPDDRYTLSSIYSAMAAQSIALAGAIDPAFTHQDIENEYVQFGFDLPFGERQYNDVKGTAEKLARFAIGTVAAMAQTNSKLTVTGSQPRQGVRLEILLPVTFGVVLLLVAVVQIVLLGIAVVLVRRLARGQERLGRQGKEHGGRASRPAAGLPGLFGRLEQLAKGRRSPTSKGDPVARSTAGQQVAQPLLPLQPSQASDLVSHQANHVYSSGGSGLHEAQLRTPGDPEHVVPR